MAVDRARMRATRDSQRQPRQCTAEPWAMYGPARASKGQYGEEIPVGVGGSRAAEGKAWWGNGCGQWTRRDGVSVEGLKALDGDTKNLFSF